MSDLPVFVPSTRTVEQAAECLWASLTKGPAEGRCWDDEPPHAKAYFNQRALDMLSGAGQHLIADVAGHLADHTEAYGIPSPQESDTQDVLLRVTGDLHTSLDL